MSTAPYVAVATVLDRVHARLTERRLARQLRREAAWLDQVENAAVLAGVVPEPEGQVVDESAVPGDCWPCEGTGSARQWDPVLMKWFDVVCRACDGTGEAGAA